MKENLTIIVTCGPNEDETTCEKNDYWEKLDLTIEDKLVIVGDLIARIRKSGQESNFVIGNQGEIVRNKKKRNCEKRICEKQDEGW